MRNHSSDLLRYISASTSVTVAHSSFQLAVTNQSKIDFQKKFKFAKMLLKVVAVLIGFVALSGANHPPPECVFTPEMDDCCAFANSTKEAEVDALMEECDNLHSGKHDYKCATECFLNKTGVLVAGKIDPEKALALTGFVAEEKKLWDPVMQAAIKKCDAWTEEGEEFKLKPGQQGCTVKAAFFINCIMGQMFIVSFRF